MIVVDQIPVILGDPGTSVVLLSGSVAQELPLSVTHKGGLSSGDRAKTVVIYVETAQIRFAFGADPNPSTPFGYPVSSGSWIILTKRSEKIGRASCRERV